MLIVELNNLSILLGSDGRATLTATGMYLDERLNSESPNLHWQSIRTRLHDGSDNINFEMHELNSAEEIKNILALPEIYSKTNIFLPPQAPSWSFLSMNEDDVTLLVCVNLAVASSKKTVQRVWDLAKGQQAVRIKCWSSDYNQTSPTPRTGIPLFLQYVSFSGSV